MRNTITRYEPFYLLYGRTATLPVEFDIPTYSNEPIDEVDNVYQHIYQLIEKLPQAWKTAKDWIHHL